MIYNELHMFISIYCFSVTATATNTQDLDSLLEDITKCFTKDPAKNTQDFCMKDCLHDMLQSHGPPSANPCVEPALLPTPGVTGSRYYNSSLISSGLNTFGVTSPRPETCEVTTPMEEYDSSTESSTDGTASPMEINDDIAELRPDEAALTDASLTKSLDNQVILEVTMLIQEKMMNEAWKPSIAFGNMQRRSCINNDAKYHGNNSKVICRDNRQMKDENSEYTTTSNPNTYKSMEDGGSPVHIKYSEKCNHDVESQENQYYRIAQSIFKEMSLRYIEFAICHSQYFNQELLERCLKFHWGLENFKNMSQAQAVYFNMLRFSHRSAYLRYNLSESDYVSLLSAWFKEYADSYKAYEQRYQEYAEVASVWPQEYAEVASVCPEEYAEVASVCPEYYSEVASVCPEEYAEVASVWPQDYAEVASVWPENYAEVASVWSEDYAEVLKNTFHENPNRKHGADQNRTEPRVNTSVKRSRESGLSEGLAQGLGNKKTRHRFKRRRADDNQRLQTIIE